MDDNAKLTHFMHLSMAKRFEEHDISFQNFFSYEEGVALYKNMMEQRATSGYLHRKRELVNRLNKVGISCTLSESDNDLEGLVERLPSGKYMEKQLINMLYEVYRKAVTPAEHIEKIVRRLGEPEFQTSSVRLAILKQFLLNTTYHTGVIADMIAAGNPDIPKTELKDTRNLARLAGEELFEVLDRNLTKDEKTKYTLLKLADDLATGRFRSNGGTKTALYMFGFAFDMTTYIDPETDEFDPERDLEKNLFFDYYANCLLRFVSEDYKAHSSDYESEPLGDGINFKNYAEVIYLYYLNRRDLSPAKRLRQANRLISECSRFVPDVSVKPEPKLLSFNTALDRYTYFYKDLYLVQIKRMEEKQLVPFICSHYEIGESNASAARITISSETNTAKFHFLRFIWGNTWTKGSEKDEKGLYREALFELTAGYDKEFVQLLQKMGEMLFNRSINKNQVTRSQIFAVYFQKYLDDMKHSGMTLLELSRDFADTVNPILEDSRYQCFSGKNLFDLFVVILLYRNLNVL